MFEKMQGMSNKSKLLKLTVFFVKTKDVRNKSAQSFIGQTVNLLAISHIMFRTLNNIKK